MFSCKDCVHYEICLPNSQAYGHKLKLCTKFKNKADVVEVKRGEWVRQKGRPEAICSECGREVVYQSIDNRWWFENYCPHCSADMRKEGADNG